jgi:hypothetical protein
MEMEMEMERMARLSRGSRAQRSRIDDEDAV